MALEKFCRWQFDAVLAVEVIFLETAVLQESLSFTF